MLQGFLIMYVSNHSLPSAGASLMARTLVRRRKRWGFLMPMKRSRFFTSLCVFLAAVMTMAAGTFPAPTIDEPAHDSKPETAVLAGGCFWGMEAVFEHVKGVVAVVSGYSGGSSDTAHSDQVEAGRTGHAESVEITYDPSQITYGQLLKVFFAVAHDPTQLNRQGPDSGTQYRSVIFFANAEQKHVAEAYIRQLSAVRVFNRKIVTEVVKVTGFYPAEDFLQRYSERHPTSAYVVQNDLPKLEALKARYPNLYR
jgi:peptide-methionine (S)-S-oxide reductase